MKSVQIQIAHAVILNTRCTVVIHTLNSGNLVKILGTNKYSLYITETADVSASEESTV